MTQAAKKQVAVTEARELDPLLRKPVPHAYALIQDPQHPAKWYAVHLINVVAERLEHLEPSKRSEPATYGLQRIERAGQKRHVQKKWGRDAD